VNWELPNKYRGPYTFSFVREDLLEEFGYVYPEDTDESTTSSDEDHEELSYRRLARSRRCRTKYALQPQNVSKAKLGFFQKEKMEWIMNHKLDVQCKDEVESMGVEIRKFCFEIDERSEEELMEEQERMLADSAARMREKLGAVCANALLEAFPANAEEKNKGACENVRKSVD
jgi:hypothetical protein